MAPRRPSTAGFSSAELAREVLASASAIEKRFYQQFLRSVSQVSQDPALLSLLSDIQAGNYIALTPGVEQRLAQINIPEADLVKIARQALTAAGRTTLSATGLQLQFDITNPRTIDYARRLGAQLVTNIRKTTRQTLRDLITEVLEGNMSMAAARKTIASQVGLIPQHVQAVRRYKQSLVAGGTPQTQANRMADKYAQRLLKYRAEMIARTEVARATSYGQKEAWDQARDANLIPPEAMRVWITAADERTCAICSPMNSVTASMDGVWETLNGPVSIPTDVHPQCRCTSGLVFPSPLSKADPLGYEWWILRKHLPGQHDQSLHGRKGPRRASPGSVDAMTVISLGKEDLEYSDSLQQLREEIHGGETKYLMSEGGSYYDEIDWDSDVDPVEQMFQSFETYTGVPIDRAIGKGLSIEDLEVEAVTETLDAITALQESWGIAPAAITFRGDVTARGSTVLAYVRPVPNISIEGSDGSRVRVNATSDREYYGQLDFNPARLTESGAALDRANHLYTMRQYKSEGAAHHVPTQVTSHQSTAIHEFGHIVHNWAFSNNPAGLWNVATTMVDSSAQSTNQRVTRRSGGRLDEGWAALEYQERRQREGIANGESNWNTYIRPGAIPTGSTAQDGGVYLSDRSFISGYSNSNGLEFFAEAFTLVYGNPGGSLPALRTTRERRFSNGRESTIVPIQQAMTQFYRDVSRAFDTEF